MFGYTIVDDYMEFWYMDRANAIISQPLSWISDVSGRLSTKSRLR